MNEQANENRIGDWVSKVPQVTLMFWVIKICATTVGETGGDAIAALMVVMIILTYRSSKQSLDTSDSERA